MRKVKLYDKIRRNPSGVRFNDLCRLAEFFGFERDHQSGSHIFYKHDRIRVTLNFQDRNGQAKAYQIRQFLDIVERHGLRIEE